MKHFVLIYLILLASRCLGQTNEGALFQIEVDGKIGFINQNGKVIIDPQFLAAGEYAEGVASARINGTYGFIDGSGTFVIAPQFDYATRFSEGLAVVFKNGLPVVIDRDGKEAFITNYHLIGDFQHGRALIQTRTKKFGFVNRSGKLVVDTVFKEIRPFVDNLAVVVGLNHVPNEDADKTKEKRLEIGVIDTVGRFVVPYGIYEEISSLAGGYFKVDVPAEPWDSLEGYTKQTGFVDKKGRLTFSRSHQNNSWIDGDIHSGLARINLYKTWIPEREGTSFTTEKSYEGFINLKGEIIFNDTTIKYVNDFSNNRAFVQTNDDDYLVIDTKGMIISTEKYSDIVGRGFSDGLAFVKKDGKYGAIDTTGNFVIPPQFEGIYDARIMEGYFFYYVPNENTNSSYDRLYGIARKNGAILQKPQLQDFDRGGFHDGLLRCIVDDKLSYVSTSGEIVWSEPKPNSEVLTDLNIDYMNRGYFCAASRPDNEDLGGFGGSDNSSKRIALADKVPPNTLAVVVRPDVAGIAFNRFNGITVEVVNSTRKDVRFNAQDSRLNMKVQAIDIRGEWRDIEYLPSSWCGNSYHILTLKSKQYWSFVTPKYQGDFQTKLRIELKYIDPSYKSDKLVRKKEITIYSNIFEGSVNPGQFWRKKEYYPSGIMDPYID